MSAPKYDRLQQSSDDIPLVPIRPHYAPSQQSANPPLYYGQAAYQQVTQNEIVERHDEQPTIVVVHPHPQPQSSAAALSTEMPALHNPTVPAGVAPVPPIGAPQPQPQPMSNNAYPAQAYAAHYPHPASLPVAMPAAFMPVQQPPLNLVPVIPPIPQTKEQLQNMLQSRRVEFDTGRYFREGWQFVRHNFCFFFGSMLFWILIGSLTYVAFYLIFTSAGWETPLWYGQSDDEDGSDYDPQPTPPTDNGPGGDVYPADGSASTSPAVARVHRRWWSGQRWSWGRMIRELLFEVLIMSPVALGYYATVFEAMRDNAKMKFRTLFSAWKCPYYMRLLGLTLIISLLTRLGMVLLIIPGVWFSIVTAFAFPLHIQFQHIPLRSCSAIKLSIITLSRYCCCSWFGFVIAAMLLNFLGVLCFFVGLFVTIPITLVAFCYAYHHLIGVNGMPIMVPAEHAASIAAAQAAPTVIVVQPQQQ